MTTTRHAQKRLQQRAIPPLIVEWLHEYGERQRRHDADVIVLDRKAKKRLARDVGHQVVDQLGSLLDAYIVVASDKLITAGWRIDRFKQH